MRTRLLATALIACLMLALPIVSAFDGKMQKENNLKLSEVKKDAEGVKEKIPVSYEAAEAKIVPVRNLFLMWTRDGKNIMWGHYGKGYFVGRDNLENFAWGIYGKNVFAGFYDGEFFFGKYRNGHWKAQGLFHRKYSGGKYVLFPVIHPIAISGEKIAE